MLFAVGAEKPRLTLCGSPDSRWISNQVRSQGQSVGFTVRARFYGALRSASDGSAVRSGCVVGRTLRTESGIFPYLRLYGACAVFCDLRFVVNNSQFTIHSSRILRRRQRPAACDVFAVTIPLRYLTICRISATSSCRNQKLPHQASKPRILPKAKKRLQSIM